MELLHTSILFLHVVGSGLVIGGILVALIIVYRNMADGTMNAILRSTWRAIEIGIGAQLVTGVYLFMSEQKDLENNHLLWAKLTLYLLAGAVAGMMIQRHLKKVQQDPQQFATSKKTLRRGLWIVLIIVLAIAALGVTIVETV